MARNLMRTNCDFCDGEVVLTEEPRLITREDCGIYYDTHDGYGNAGMIVAFAECKDCEAKYLARIDGSACAGYGLHDYYRRRTDAPFFDLSFRQSFNDEPGSDDLPVYEIEVVRVRKPNPICSKCGKRVYRAYGCQCPKDGVS